jgi:hypothetical protein
MSQDFYFFQILKILSFPFPTGCSSLLSLFKETFIYPPLKISTDGIKNKQF